MSVRLTAVVALFATATAFFAAVPAGAAATRANGATSWKVGDCYAQAAVDYDQIDLSSKVPCTEEHAVQVVGGGALPKAFAKSDLADVRPGGAQRDALVAATQEICAPGRVAANLYPKAAKQLARLFERNDVSEWMIPLSGRLGWVLPDSSAWDAGDHSVLCVYEPDDSLTGTTVGDARKVSSRTPLETLRLCYKFRPDGSAADFVPCTELHDVESLIWLALDVTGRPADVATWADADWEGFDQVCVDFAKAVIGAAPPKGFLVRADTQPDVPPQNGTRFFNCRIYPESETIAMKPGEIITGAGSAKIATVAL